MIRNFNVTYPDFQLGQIINPDEFDVNNADIVIRINQIVDVLNQITDGVGGNGADIIHIGDILPFTSERLQDFLQQLVNQLRSNEFNSGARFIGASPIEGVQGVTIQDQIESLNALLISVRDNITTQVNNLQSRVVQAEDAVAGFHTRIVASEQGITTLTSTKANASDVYTRQQVDTNIAHLDAEIFMKYYDKIAMDTQLAQKTDVTGNHLGRWQGIQVSDLASVIGAQNMVISNNQPSNPSERLLWFNPSTHVYTLFLDGRWRVSGTSMKIVRRQNRVVLNANTLNATIGIPNFDARYDALMVFQNGTFLMDGLDYTVNSTGTSITRVGSTQWVSGTTLDFVAFVSIPTN